MPDLSDKVSELLPCPFCGGTNAMMFPPTCRPETPYNPADRLFPVVRCMTCYTEVCGNNEDYAGKSAIECWNRRTRPPASSMEGWRQPEPVAWRYLFDVEAEEGLDWEYRAERPAFTPFGEEYVTVEPLYAAAPSQPPSAEGWRTMDSAPKDGTRVILDWGGAARVGYYLDNSTKYASWQGWKVPSMEEWPKGQPERWMPFPSLAPSPIPPEVKL